MKIITLLLIISFCFLSRGQDIQLLDKLSVSIYPFSGGDMGYVIKVDKEKLEVSYDRLKIEDNSYILDSTLIAGEINLDKRQLKKINCYVCEIKKIQHMEGNNNQLFLDSWYINVSINNSQKFETNTKDLSNNKNLLRLNKLIGFLIKISPLEIKLRGFS